MTPRRIREIFAEASGPVLSFEFFPPKTEEGEEALVETARRLARFSPGFVSVTYGAGGTTRDTSSRMVTRIQKEVGLTATAHLTGIAHTKDELREIVLALRAAGIVNFLALRGDPPRDKKVPPPEVRRRSGGFGYAADVVRFIRALPGCGPDEVSIAVAGYPEVHPEAESAEKDLERLVEKVEAGADLVITQLFFRASDFLTFADRARRAGVRVPIVPGVMPVTKLSQVRRFTEMCGATIPGELEAPLVRAAEQGDDSDAVFEVGVAWATTMCRELLAAGVPGIHFYTLNKSPATGEILARLGMPAPA